VALVGALVGRQLGLDLVLVVVVVVGERPVDLTSVRPGYSTRICSGVLPCLWRKTTLLTRTRVAPMAALPPQYPGSLTMCA
jgi:hypothetical protein